MRFKSKSIQNLLKLFLATPFLVLMTACGNTGGGGGNTGGGSSGPSTPAAVLYQYGITDGASQSAPGNVLVAGIDSSGAVVTGQTYTGVTTSAPFAEATATVGGLNFLYVVDPNSNVVDEFSVNGLTVTKLGSVSTGVGPESITVDKSNRFVFVGDTNNTTAGGGDIYAYSINANGTLSQVGTTPAFNNSDPVYAVQEDTTGTYLIAACEVGNPVTGWVAKRLTVNTDGTLTNVGASSAGAGIVPSFFSVVPNTTNGDILYGGVFYAYPAHPYLYTVVVTGTSVALTSMAQQSNTNVAPVWIDPTGTWLFVATYNISGFSETLTQYKIGSSGALTIGPEGTFTIAAGSSSGDFGGVTNSGAGYISSTGTVLVPYGGGGASLLYNSITGSLSSPVSVSLAGADGNAVFLP